MADEYRKFCIYKYIAGVKKGEICGRFCRKGRDYCYNHSNQISKIQKKRATISDESTSTISQTSEPIDIPKQKVEILSLKDKTPQKKEKRKVVITKDSSSSSSSSSFSSSSDDSGSSSS